MISFFFAPQNTPFLIAIGVMAGITLLEAADLFFGAGISDLIESAMPEMDLDVDGGFAHGDAAEIDASEPSGFVKVLGWLRFGQVPILVILILFLTFFGLAGLGFQLLSKSLMGKLTPAILASIPAFIVSLPMLRAATGAIARIVPKDETDAVSEKSFIGRTATIVLGKASPGKPAQAKLQDKHGLTHYVMVEPDEPVEIFEQGTTVLLVDQAGAVFKAIRNRHEILKHE